MDNSFEKNFELNKLLNNESKKLLDLKIVEALFSILYKNNLISSKEYNTLIAHLNRKLQEYSN